MCSHRCASASKHTMDVRNKEDARVGATMNQGHFLSNNPTLIPRNAIRSLIEGQDRKSVLVAAERHYCVYTLSY